MSETIRVTPAEDVPRPHLAAAAPSAIVTHMGRQDDRSPLVRALDAADGLKAGTWESVEALAALAIEAKDQPGGVEALASARSAASGLKAGSWESVRALAWLARAERELGSS